MLRSVSMMDVAVFILCRSIPIYVNKLSLTMECSPIYVVMVSGSPTLIHAVICKESTPLILQLDYDYASRISIKIGDQAGIVKEIASPLIAGERQIGSAVSM